MNYNPYSALQDADRQAMLASMRMTSIDELLGPIPKELRLRAQMDLPEPLAEWELDRHMRVLASENRTVLSMTSFLGNGFYEHHIPAAVDALSERGEFLTSYTPYQPEMSQGSLQVIAEYQHVVGELLGVPLVNASSYDGATAFADGFAMALRADRSERRGFMLADTVWPQSRMIVSTYFTGGQAEVVSATYGTSGQLDLEALEATFRREPPIAFGFQTPNKFGVLENVEAVASLCRKYAVTSILSYHPLLSGLFGSPGEMGVDIICGEGQVLGNYLYSGGASLGILGCRAELAPHIPGRLVGLVQSDSGKSIYSLIRQEREQHVSRERATSNICSNQALCAMRAVFYLSLLGDGGLERLARSNVEKAQSFSQRLCTIPGVSLAFDAPFFNEFLLQVPVSVSKLLTALKAHGVYGGTDGASLGLPGTLLIAVTETKSDEQLGAAFQAFQRCIHDLSAETSNRAEPRVIRDRPSDGFESIGKLKARALDLLAKCEVDCVRHYTRLSQKNYSIDQGMYPLGSCTMKYNPKRNDKYANLDGFRYVHPGQPSEDMQGTLRLLHRVEHYVSEITGMDGACLHPAAGAHGELTGLLMMRQHFLGKGEQRDVLLIADSAHGTNPSSASMAGFTCEIVASDQRGLLSVDDLRKKMGKRVAGLMITNPSTLGLFEEHIAEIASIVHAAGGLLYCDGANMNALMGLARPGDMGFDLVHINVHKTLSTPHGAGGPGAGPVAAKRFLLDYMPIPKIVKTRDAQSELGLDWQNSASLGKLKQHIGHVSVLIRAYCYVRTLGAQGLQQVSQDAVLSANYLQHRLKPYFPPVFDRTCMHECLLSADRMGGGASALALSKQLITRGMHPPTLTGAGCVWFPAAFRNTLLIEPTETESISSLDHFVEVMIESFHEVRRMEGDGRGESSSSIGRAASNEL